MLHIKWFWEYCSHRSHQSHYRFHRINFLNNEPSKEKSALFRRVFKSNLAWRNHEKIFEKFSFSFTNSILIFCHSFPFQHQIRIGPDPSEWCTFKMVHGPFVINSNLIQNSSGFLGGKFEYSEFWQCQERQKKHVTASQVNIFIARVVHSQPIVGCKVWSTGFKAQLTLLLLDGATTTNFDASRLFSSSSEFNASVPNRILSSQCLASNLRLFMRAVKEVTRNSMNW